MLTFEQLIEILVENGITINPDFRCPDDIQFIQDGFEEIHLTNGISIIFCRVSFNDMGIVTMIGEIDDESLIEEYTIIEKITDDIIDTVFKKYGVTN